ncbi:hypothetical protein B0T09DRAFT_339638 [Sordaria sp. MPI-SDFR-AT-0083]|nr:hypothetical protein B0T09DRAFT_339638 [Sordaria sp. MPI-SDFR-AT-0083]
MDRRKEGKKERGGYDLDFVFSLLFFPKVISGLDSLGLVISVIYQRVAFGVKFFLGGWLGFEPGAPPADNCVFRSGCVARLMGGWDGLKIEDWPCFHFLFSVIPFLGGRCYLAMYHLSVEARRKERKERRTGMAWHGMECIPQPPRQGQTVIDVSRKRNLHSA